MEDNNISREDILQDNPGETITALLKDIPGRWGRMSYLSRLVLVEISRLLQQKGVVEPAEKLGDKGLHVGLVGGTRRGSLYTDNSFIETMKLGPHLASPALFGYTLPNTPLAEAAVALGLKGPVFAVFDEVAPMETAVSEAKLYLNHDRELDFMLVCEFDHYVEDKREIDSVKVSLVDR